ncbi:ABC transporter substrate-binding protein [Nonomuraea roseoviolacea subsp. roseoviolacea]|uniref:ABC transporter substrate-binding protein n=1 Tax=Nonomuraea roseoviolacea TaxID=103837 RepID=UPI0031E09CF2
MNNKGAAAVLGAVSLLAAGCGGTAGSPSGAPAGGGTFTYAITGDPGALDPATSVLSVTNNVLAMAYDTLVNTTADGTVVSGLAEKWDVRPDAVTFTLRKDVTCSDGSPLTPRDVAANIAHITDPATKSPINGVLVPAGLAAEADDAAGTVKLSTPKPFSFILQSAASIFIVCGKGLKDRTLLTRGTSGSGPYRLTEAVPGDHYTFRVRQDYAWGPGGATTKTPGQPTTIVMKVVLNEQTAANLLISGGLNGAELYGADRARLEATPGIGRTVQPVGNGQFFYHQGADRPAKDPAVRKALTQAVDLRQLAGIASGGTGRPVTGLVLEPRPCRGDTVTGHVPPHDAAAASAALDAAGWTKGADGIRAKNGNRLTLRLLYSTARGSGVQAAAEFLADAWKQAGVEVKLNGVIDTKAAESLNVTQDWDVVWLPIGVTLPSQLVAFLSGPAVPKGANFAHIANARYEKLVAEASAKPAQEGCPLWQQAESALFANADLVPVVENTILVAARNATFEALGDSVLPTTIRMTEGG